MTYRNKHIGVIPDGGRRWSRKKRISLVDSYNRTFSRLFGLLLRAYQAGFSEASVYVLSKRNLSRSSDDLNAVFTSFGSLYDTIQKLCNSSACSTVHLIGKTDILPGETQEIINNIASLYGKANGLKVNLLVAYDAWDELMESIMRNGKTINIGDLWVRTEVDAVIRTGGTALLSGFLPLQTQYAHILATQELFNELSDVNVDQLIQRAFAVRHRFGK